MRAFLTLGILLFYSALLAQVVVKGRIMDEKGEPIPFASVGIKNTATGTSSGEEGKFELVSPNGSTLVISAIGYLSTEWNVTAVNDEDQLVITLREDVFGLEEVVVTGTMTERFLKASPIKVEVVTSNSLQRTIAPVSLVEGISLINGLQEVVACGVCYTNSISINGLPGPYTAVLVDGLPLFGNLASVYGLNGISTQVIDRIEVIKGPNSTLYGSEAMAGVINIITKDPDDQPFFKADIMGTSHIESFGNLALAPAVGKSKGLIGLNYAYINDFDDWNEDGFGDVVNLDRWALFTKWNLHRKSGLPFVLSGKLYYEDRRNGTEAYLTDRAYRKLRGSDEIYGESILTKRAELFGSYSLDKSHSIDFSMSHHDQDSWYGSDTYLADQTLFFTNIKGEKELKNHSLLYGISLRKQLYDDNTVATESSNGSNVSNEPDNQFIPGLFIQDEFKSGDKFSLLTGLRVDHHETHGLEWSPRINLRFNLKELTTIRLNAGTGFKLVNLFTEDHAFVTGQRDVVIEEGLLPERSLNLTVNLNHVYISPKGQGMIDFDVFHSTFTNKIIPDYSQPGLILYGNTDGRAVGKGIGASINHQFDQGLGINMSATIMRVEEIENGERTPIVYTPEWTSVNTINYLWKKPGLDIAYTLRLTGPMALPEVFDLDENGEPLQQPRPVRSSTFGFQNLQVTKSVGERTEFYLGIQNLLNYRQQESPLIGYNDPNYPLGFSPFFDTSYSYGPVHGRELYLGIRVSSK